MRFGFARRCAFILLVCALVRASQIFAQDFKRQVIYQIITDRFFDGDPTNNDPPQSKGMYDPTKTNWQAYWGGDFAGIEDKLPYLHSMGVTAIWISPPVDNSNRPWMGPDGKPVPYLFAPYHGYGARDFLQLEEHFGSAKNDWKAFDSMVTAAHKLGIKIIVDFSPNDTNLIYTGEHGAVYAKGKLMGTYGDDTKQLYHHFGPLTDWNDSFQVQYHNVFDLADLNHQNPVVDRYIKDSVLQFEQHGVDAFRIDAVKHISWGWVYSLADTARAHSPVFLFAEWFEGGVNDPFYGDSVKFSNNSGIPLLDYPLAVATRDVFAYGKSFTLIDKVLAEQDKNFKSPNDLVTFVDNHDIPRLMSVNNNRNRLDEATAFVLTARGIPIVYYGDEQYLHNDTNKGMDPYTRPWMSSYDETSRGYRLVQRLAALRKTNDALAYGDMKPLFASEDAYVFERRFGNDIVLVAINKNENTPMKTEPVHIDLPPGPYADVLDGLMGGDSLNLAGPELQLTLAPHSVGVWQMTSKTNKPEVGSLEPLDGEPGMRTELRGLDFGMARGSVRFGDTSGQVIFWSNERVVVRVPKIKGGNVQVTLTDHAGHFAPPMNFTVHQASLVPVTFTLHDTPKLEKGDRLYVTGNTYELGSWQTKLSATPGPFLCPQTPTCFLDISVPAKTDLQFSYFIVGQDGTIRWREEKRHEYTVPAVGTGSVSSDANR